MNTPLTQSSTPAQDPPPQASPLGAQAHNLPDRLNPIVVHYFTHWTRTSALSFPLIAMSLFTVVVYAFALLNPPRFEAPLEARIFAAACICHIIFFMGISFGAGSLIGKHIKARLKIDNDNLMLTALGPGRFLRGHIYAALILAALATVVCLPNTLVIFFLGTTPWTPLFLALIITAASIVFLTLHSVTLAAYPEGSLVSLLVMLPTGILSLFILQIGILAPAAILFNIPIPFPLPFDHPIIISTLAVLSISFTVFYAFRKLKQRANNVGSVPQPGESPIPSRRAKSSTAPPSPLGKLENLPDRLNPIFALHLIQITRAKGIVIVIALFLVLCTLVFSHRLPEIINDSFLLNNDKTLASTFWLFIIMCAILLPFSGAARLRVWQFEDPHSLLLLALGNRRYIRGHLLSTLALIAAIFVFFPVFGALSLYYYDQPPIPVATLTLLTLPILASITAIIVLTSSLPKRPVITYPVAAFIIVFVFLLIFFAGHFAQSILSGRVSPLERTTLLIFLPLTALIAYALWRITLHLVTPRTPDKSDAYLIGRYFARILPTKPALTTAAPAQSSIQTKGDTP